MTSITKRIMNVFAALVLLTGTAYADSYLVWGNGAWNKQNNKAVSAADGTIVRQFPQIGMVVVESDNPDFMSNISGVAGVVPNFRVSAPQRMTFATDDLPQPPTPATMISSSTFSGATRRFVHRKPGQPGKPVKACACLFSTRDLT